MTATARAPTTTQPHTRVEPPPVRTASEREPTPSASLEVAPVWAIVRAVTRRVRERPFTAVAAAVAVGVIVGGGLSFRLGRLLLAAASRHVAREVLKQVL